MNILVTSIGTRGDMEPFLAIGEMLSKRGHQITCLFPEQFRSLATDSGFEFQSLGEEFIQMLESDVGKYAIGGGGNTLQKFVAYFKLAQIQKENNRKMVAIQKEVIDNGNFDRIIHNGKVMYPVVWETTHPQTTVFVSPVPDLHYSKGSSHLAFGRNYGDFINKLTFRLADWGLSKTIMAAVKWLGIDRVSKKQIDMALRNHRCIYTIAPQLYPRPDDWPENIKVMGYHERNKNVNWKPDTALINFLDLHPRKLLVTFGSMTNPFPERKTQTILNVLSRLNIPAVINTAGGGLVKPAEYDSNQFYFVDRIPYDWAFPKVDAVVHHGGSGTTHMGIYHGLPTLIIPHIIDQFVWNRIVHEKGAGPLGVKISKVSESTLLPLFQDLWDNPAYQKAAMSIGKEMKADHWEEKIVKELTRDV